MCYIYSYRHSHSYIFTLNILYKIYVIHLYFMLSGDTLINVSICIHTLVYIPTMHIHIYKYLHIFIYHIYSQNYFILQQVLTIGCILLCSQCQYRRKKLALFFLVYKRKKFRTEKSQMTSILKQNEYENNQIIKITCNTIIIIIKIYTY